MAGCCRRVLRIGPERQSATDCHIANDRCSRSETGAWRAGLRDLLVVPRGHGERLILIEAANGRRVTPIFLGVTSPEGLPLLVRFLSISPAIGQVCSRSSVTPGIASW